MKDSTLSELLNRRLALLGERNNLSLLEQCLHGIERECLRITGQAELARTQASVEEALIEMYLAGVSVRRVEDITEAL